MAEALNPKPKQWESAQGIPEQRAYEETRRRQARHDEISSGDYDPFLLEVERYGGPSTYNPMPSYGRATTNPPKKEVTE